MTRISFEGPPDFSIGEVEITGEGGMAVHRWTATSETRTYEEDLAPGYYCARIEPLGVSAQAVVFEVKPDEDKVVSAPSFSSLLATNGNLTFLEIDDPQAAIERLFPPSTVAEMASVAGPPETPFRSSANDTAQPYGTSPAASIVPVATGSRRLSLYGSVELRPGSWAFTQISLSASLEVSDSRLAAVIRDHGEEIPGRDRRLRLTMTIEGVREQHLLLPLYREGVQIAIVPSAILTDDVDLEVLPAEPRLRALARALIAGTVEEAKAVAPMARTAEQLTSEQDIDPWEALLSALLSIRFPVELPGLTPALADALVGVAPWSFDAHVIQAHQHLYAAGKDEPREPLLKAAVQRLANAQTCGQPYFAYSNELYAQLIDGVTTSLDRYGLPELAQRASELRVPWVRQQALQTRAAASFSWLEQDVAVLRTGSVSPLRATKGFPPSNVPPIFSGHLSGGRIRMDPAIVGAPAKEQAQAAGPTSGDAPPDHATPTPRSEDDDDPNLGCFGECREVAGYAVEVSFEYTDNASECVIEMAVVARAGTIVPPGAVAWFCLHPTFNPRWVKVLFGDTQARLAVTAWGGFTVGVWLPHALVELECDLSKVAGAPDIIRLR